ncbi:hypothetical protein PHYSODRAFT_502847 [Phytophthora sojae]|uniref:Uncharacterized protein n=1 Tax=Phytophthora sojae (strain P6497) TaxID=1094619 RepID=G4ZJE6_PHYSP|nr:hypothetical protein PHYSODRAFT_502847 [Phytophthora sojae]EGZ18220.1 hypothetical protein PHYSODRAFT_502847 [Phytophthora sojae]|eukprot:XP_009527278.1 hypothetical protein PHYSODRAFT_502847 [Phytophthora sojae]
MQLSYYGGRYSIQRVLAFDEYTKKTSLTRVVLVCFTTPLPMVALVFGQELVPLQELREGWSANYGMWFRAAVLVGIVTHALLVQGMYLIDDFVVSVLQMLQLYVIMPAIIVAFSLVVSAYCVFPIPFYIMFITPPFYLLLVVMIRVVVGSHAFRQMLTHHDQVGRCVRFVCAQTSTVFIFPVYEMLFSAAEGTKYQLPVILLLPVIKVALKNLVLHFAKALDDMAPVEVIFTADFFNAIYVATCMQSSSSPIAIAAIIITDLLQTITMLYGLQRRTATILSRLRQTAADAKESDDVLSMMCSLFHNREMIRRVIVFTTECIIITAYLETFMPLFYSSYMMLMVHLPNVKYHVEMEGVTRDNVVSSVLPLVVFGLLQIASFVSSALVIKRNCGMEALYQLAFVLEAQRSLIQCKMMLWMVITLCFRVTHFGVDFKFEFIRLGFPRIWYPQG